MDYAKHKGRTCSLTGGDLKQILMRAFFTSLLLISVVLFFTACVSELEDNTPNAPKIAPKQLIGSWLFEPTDSSHRVGGGELNDFYFCSLDLFSDSTFTYWYESRSGECRGATMLGLYSLNRTSNQLSFYPENHFLASHVHVLTLENESLILQLPGKDLASMKWKRTNGIITAVFESNSSQPKLEFKRDGVRMRGDTVNVIYHW